MQRYILSVLISVVFFPLIASADFSDTDKGEIQQHIKTIEYFLERGDVTGIVALISPNASSNLKSEIETNLSNKKIKFKQEQISKWTTVSPSSVKIEGNFSASGYRWELNGLSNYFILEKVNDHWLLLDTDFHQKLGPEFLWKFFKRIMTIVVPIVLVTFAFWVWMLVDCLKKPSKDKLIWVLLIVFLNLLGAILYFFIERKKQGLPQSSL